MPVPAAATDPTVRAVVGTAVLSKLLPESPEFLLLLLVGVGMLGGFVRAMHEPLPVDSSRRAWLAHMARAIPNGVFWSTVAFGVYEAVGFVMSRSLPPIGGFVVASFASFGQVEVARGLLRILDKIPLFAEKKYLGKTDDH